MTLLYLVYAKYFKCFSHILFKFWIILCCLFIRKMKQSAIRKICFLFPDRLYFEHPNYDVLKICILPSQSTTFFGDIIKKNVIVVNKICTGQMTKLMMSNDIIYQWASLVHFSFIIMSGSWNFGQVVGGESLLNVPIIHPQNIENLVFCFQGI